MLNDNTVILKSFLEGLKPIPRMTVSEWADKNRFLSSASSAEPGRFRTSRTPYVREIADNLGKTSDVWKNIVKKAAQLALTELGNNWIGSIMDINPGPVIMVMPTEESVKKNSRTRITPMINSTPALRDKIKSAGSKEGNNTIMNKEFPGGFLIMIGANSPTGLRSTPAGNIFLDEVDGYPLSSGDEGSPIDLAEARASTFSNKKIFIISTPTTEGSSVIDAEFLEGDRRYYNVPCQGCGDLFVLKFDYLTWDKDSPETTRLACPVCGFLHEERHKTTMLSEEGYGGRAKWVPTAKPSDPLVRSYHISGLYSPAGWLSWEQIVRKYLKALKDENKMKTFVNTVLGETYKITAEVPDADMLYDRRENYEVGVVPAGVHFLTMGVDTQNDRIEYDIVGWGPGRESWDVKYGVLEGDTAKPEVWEKLSEVVDSQFPTHDGNFMALRQVAIDSQGHRTSEVYAFCKKHGYSKVIPIRGANVSKSTGVMVTQSKATTVTKGGKKIGGNKVWTVDTYMLKEELYANLRLTSVEGKYPPGYCHFPMYERHYFKMLTAEELRLQKDAKGFDKWQWVKVFERNEVLDMRGYARAAAYLVGIDRLTEKSWDKIKNSSITSAESVPHVKTENKIATPDRKIKKSDYWNRKR